MISWISEADGCLEVIGAILLIVVIWAAISFATAGIALWLWNIIAIPVFAAPVVGYWQMFGIMWLLRLLIPTPTFSSRKG